MHRSRVGSGGTRRSASKVRLLLQLRTLLAVLPFVLTGVPLIVFGLVLGWFSIDRVQGLIYYSRYIAVGMFLLCAGLLVIVALRRSDAHR